MPHPRVPEGTEVPDVEAVSVYALPTAEPSNDQQQHQGGQTLSDEIDYKDQGRTYIHFLEGEGRGTSNNNTPVAQAQFAQQEGGFLGTDRRPSRRPDPSAIILDGDGSFPSSVAEDPNFNGGDDDNNNNEASLTPPTKTTFSNSSSVEDSKDRYFPARETSAGRRLGCVASWSKTHLFLVVVGGVLLLGVGLGVAIGLAKGGGGGGGGENNSASGSDIAVLDLVSPALDGEVDSRFGLALSLDNRGTCVAIADLSSVRVFGQEGDKEWAQLGGAIPAPPNTTTTYGFDQDPEIYIRTPVAVKLSGDGKAVAVGWNTQNGHVGMVQVYRFNLTGTNEWEAHGGPLYGENPGDHFGAYVNLSEDGGILSIVAPGNGGSLMVYQFNIGMWQTFGTQISMAQIGKLSVTSVALSQNGYKVAIGGVPGDDNIASRVFDYEIATGDWSEAGVGITGKQQTAYVVDLSGDGMTLALSNYYFLPNVSIDDNAALDVRAFAYSVSANSWRQKGDTLHAFEPGAKDGYFISLSNDGSVICMGDPGRSGAGSGINAGHAHIYTFDESSDSFSQLGPDIEGMNAADFFGYAVAVAGNGQRFASGAPFSRARGTNSFHGQVLVYEILHEAAEQ